jgi:hypothetical protein
MGDWERSLSAFPTVCARGFTVETLSRDGLTREDALPPIIGIKKGTSIPRSVVRRVCRPTDAETTMRRTNVILWTIQGLLALAFLFAGGMKLLTPTATLAQLVGSVPVALVRFIGVCEVTGALGLILPGLLKVRPALTPLAAAGLVIIMSGAVSAMITLGRAPEATAPAILGILAIIVVLGRRRS